MAIKLKNDELKIQIETAGERYRGSRFDWNGLVSSFRWKGNELLGQEKPAFHRNPKIFGRGLHNEFGIKKVLGYDDVAPGEWFPKIGTGWLRRDEKPYFFYTRYQVEPVQTSWENPAKDRAVFHSDSGVRNGWGWRYTKEVRIEGPSLKISYTLENIGEKVIETDEYVHNFLSFDGRPVGPGYRLILPFAPEPSRLIENVNPDGVLALNEKDIEFRCRPRHDFYLGGLSEGVGEKDGLAAGWTLTDERTGLSLCECGSFKPSGVHLWGNAGVISPELFYSFKIESGDIMTWERVWTAGKK
ncbi:hypothetical protein K7J14_12370 [Treponema zuelzerae]|uniref:Uncharacterized protein n=1 Tax=Teretinema zuelzerae TaxID=156 RepID=A0AAE3EI82_9SPIR|nr:hypothetical protein [Teretinema zuelzerae]MCD1655490.1 hypothetical protein [Teretinema zuelzerae]